MSPEVIEMLRDFSLGVRIVGGLATLVFFIDYIRSADLSSIYSKMLLGLNGAISIVLWTSVALHAFTPSPWIYLLGLASFVVVDLMLILQIVLLRQARKGKKGS